MNDTRTSEREEAAGRLKRYARWQETVAALGQIALESSDLQNLMAQTARRLADVLQIEYVGILELTAGGQSLVLRAGHGWAKSLIGHATVAAGAQSQAGFTLLVNEPIIVADLRAEKRFAGATLLWDHGVISGVTVAIGGRPRAFGVLGVHSKQLRHFAADDVYFLRAVANVLAAAVRAQDAEQAQHDAAARVQAILTTLVDGVITIDEQGTIESINPAAEQIFGYSAAEVIGQNVDVLMPEPYRKEHDGYLRNYLRTGKKHIIGFGREVSGMRKDKSTFPMDLAISELRVGGKRMFTGVVRDMTERRRLEMEILQAGAEEQRRIGQDLHDGLCQHLTGIAFGMEVLKKKLAARSAPETAGIRSIGEMVDQAITQARDLARGLQPVTLEANGLVSALKTLVEKIETMFHVKCLFVCDGPVLIHDYRVATHLYRIAQEAISNAVKHGKARMVIVDLSAEGEELRLSIKDNGVGLEPVAEDSQGMGLRTMDYRARLIGGRLSVQPGDGGGTSVVCIVQNNQPPNAAVERPAHGEEKENRRARPGQNPRRRRSSHRP